MKKNYLTKTVVILLLSVSALTAQDYTNLIKDNLIETRSAQGLQTADVAELTIYNQSTSRTSGVEHVYAVQKYNGIEIFNGNVSAAFRGDELIHLGDNTIKGIESKIIGTSPVLTPVQAALSAASLLGAGNANFTVLETISAQEVVLSQGGVSLDNVPVKLVYQRTEDNELRLAWDLSIHMTDQPHWYSVRVDASSGEILDTIDWIVSCSFDTDHNHNGGAVVENRSEDYFGFKEQITSTVLAGEQYNVFAVPLESPLDGPRSIVTEPQDLVASPFGWHDTDGAEGVEFTITRGNNVWAFEDVDGMSDIGESPDGGEDLIFDFPLNDNLDASTFIPASTTNLFYWNNILHDVMYQYGFDEESGNFQTNNYGNGGSADDFVFALAQDGSGANNATFATPPDGQNPVMRMFLFTTSGEGPQVVISSGPLAGQFPITTNTFSADWPSGGITGNLVLAMDDDASVESEDPLDICDALTNAADLDGNIAVLRRGQCDFSLKVETVQAAGAIAVIVVNNDPSNPVNLGGDSTIATIPAGMVTQDFGEDLITALEAGDSLNDITITGGRLIDGSLDNGIIGHEYGHGISNRLTGGRFNANCLGTPGSEGRGMGEGWSDYYGLMLTMKPGDTAEQARGIGNYAFNQPTTGPGIRVRPYSTSFAINELTYGDIANTGAIPQPHGIGTVWATAIWDMTWAFIDQYGFDADLYNGTGGNNIALQLVTDGLKLQPCNPGFVDARDGILAAVELNPLIPEGDRDFALCTIWNVFAERGLGASANQGSAFSRTDGTEAFDIPADVLENCDSLLTVADNNLDSAFSVFPNPSNGQININITSSLGQGQVQIVDLNGRVVFSQDMVLEGTLNINASSLSKGVYIVQVSNTTISDTAKLIIR